MDYPCVVIIILNWNGWSDTIECIESVFQINYPNFRVLIVDNYSSDDSIQKIKDFTEGKIKVKSKFFKYDPNNKPIEISIYNKEEFESETFLTNNKQLNLLKNEKNYGFAEGNNIGIKFALKNLNPDYILLLNNDTVVEKDFLAEMTTIGENNKEIGILGPKIYYYNKPNKIWSVGAKISWKTCRGIHVGINEKDNGQYEEKKEVEYVSGSAFLIKTEVIQKIGLLNKEFFLYFEETDWTLRASEMGYKSFYIPKAKIWHKVSKSGGGISKPIGLYYITRNRWLFMDKWAKNGDYAFFIIYQILGAIILPITLSIYYKNYELFKAYYCGLFDGLISKGS
jgi:GT2 family glycosyltransferase